MIAVINILIDIVILSLPISTLKEIKRDTRDKIVLFLIFGVGGFSCISRFDYSANWKSEKLIVTKYYSTVYDQGFHRFQRSVLGRSADQHLVDDRDQCGNNLRFGTR